MPGGMALKYDVLSGPLCALCGMCLDWCPYIKNLDDHLTMVFDCGLDDGRCYAGCPRTFTDWGEIAEKCLPGVPDTGDIGRLQGVYKARGLEAVPGQQDGGTVTGLIKTALGKGLVDAALLTASEDGMAPQPVLCTGADEVDRAAGSRFLAAPGLRKIVEAAAQGYRRLAIVARPCQVQALRKLQMSGKPGLPDQVLVIGLFCMWSLNWGFRDFVQTKLPGARITRLSIPRHGMVVETDQGELVLDLEQVRQFIRTGCSYCLDMTSELADISVGSLEIEPGWNTVLVRSTAGRELMEKAVASGKLEVSEYPTTELERLKGASLNKKIRALEQIKKDSEAGIIKAYIDLKAEPYQKALEGRS